MSVRLTHDILFGPGIREIHVQETPSRERHFINCDPIKPVPPPENIIQSYS